MDETYGFIFTRQKEKRKAKSYSFLGEGEKERKSCFNLMKNKLRKQFKNIKTNKRNKEGWKRKRKTTVLFEKE